MRMPLPAERQRILRIVVQCGVPSATPASRSAVGCSLSMSSVVRVMIGTAISASATAPAMAEKWPIEWRDQDIDRRTGRPAPTAPTSRMSFRKRMTLRVERALPPYSASQVPARMPTTIAITIASTQIDDRPDDGVARGRPASPTAVGRQGEHLQVDAADALASTSDQRISAERVERDHGHQAAEADEDGVGDRAADSAERCHRASQAYLSRGEQRARDRQHDEGDAGRARGPARSAPRECMALVASLNSLAMVEAIVEPTRTATAAGRANCR